MNEKNLSIGGGLLLAEIVVGVTAAFALSNFGIAPDWALVATSIFNFVPASFLAKAARARGKNPLFYGVVSALGPPGALFVYQRLRSLEIVENFDRRST